MFIFITHFQFVNYVYSIPNVRYFDRFITEVVLQVNRSSQPIPLRRKLVLEVCSTEMPKTDKIGLNSSQN